MKKISELVPGTMIMGFIDDERWCNGLIVSIARDDNNIFPINVTSLRDGRIIQFYYRDYEEIDMLTGGSVEEHTIE